MNPAVTTRTARVLCGLILCAVPLLGSAAAQESAAPFDAAHIAFPPDTSVRCLADLDGDGRVEALGLWNYPSDGEVRISGFRADAQGAFTRLWSIQGSFPGVGGRADMETGDLDGDGRPDFVVAFHSMVRAYVSRGLGQPVEWAALAANGASRAVIADFNGDGRNDVAATAIGFLGPILQVWVNSGTGLVDGGTANVPNSGTPGTLERTEINGDAAADLMIPAGNTVWLFRVAGGVPVLHGSYPTVLSDLHLCSGDVDQDGDQDIVAFGIGNYQVLRRTGPGTFTLESWRGGGLATDLADVDGDGDLDGIACMGSGGGTGLNSRSAAFQVAINSGGGAFVPAFQIPWLGSLRVAGAADVDGDGDKDLIAGRCIYYARGPLTRSPFVRLPVQNSLTKAVVDIDQDGDPDPLPGALGALHNNGDATFRLVAPVCPPAPPGTRWNGPGFLGDFDGDGDLDLLVSHVQGSYYEPECISMRLLRNAGGGGFLDGGPATAPGVDMNLTNFVAERDQPYWTVVGDLDNDGDLDLVVNDARTTDVAVTRAWLNDGQCFFTSGFHAPSIVTHAIVDLDGDQRTDLVTTEGYNFASATLAVRHGRGGALFGPAVAPNAVTTTHLPRIGVVDWDGDGDLDLVGGRDSSWYLSIWSNQGGQFTPLTGTPPVGRDGGRWVTTGDVNADGRKDLLIGPWTAADTGTGILLQQPDGRFQLATEQVLPRAEYYDLDGDGDDDTFVDYALVRNFTRHGAAFGRRVQYGTASAGTGGMLPVLGGRGPFLPGASVETRLSGAVGGGLGLYVFGLSQVDLRDVPVPGMSLYVGPPLVVIAVPLSGAPGQPGAGSAVVSYQVTPDLAGLTFFKQMFVVDVGMPNYLAASNGLMVQFGM